MNNHVGRFLFALGLLAAGHLRAGAGTETFEASTDIVGPSDRPWQPTTFVTPVNQRLTPAGFQVELPGMRPNALALSPDHRLLVTAGHTHQLIVISAQTGKILQQVPLPANDQRLPTDNQGELSFTGLAFSPDGSRIYLSNVHGDIKVFGVADDGFVSPREALVLPPASAPDRKVEMPAGLAVARDGKAIYVALNLSDRLAELEVATGKVRRQWETGAAPFGVALAGGKIYVSNWGGRRPGAQDPTGAAGWGSRVRVDPATAAASEGSVSIIDLKGAPTVELVTGRHTSALAVSPNGRYVVAANAGSDTVSVIDTRTDQVVETILVRQSPGDPFGAQPNALEFDKSGDKLFVCNGTQNAVAVVQFDPGKSRLLGLIPAGWFPDAVVYDARRRQIDVANLRGLSRGTGPFNDMQYYNTLSLVEVPSAKKLGDYTRTALANLRYPLLAQAGRPARTDQPARPVPERVGEPSVFHHVIYIIKENRTYDQVLGDVKAGNGNASLCNFGARVTPNQHQLVREFVLLDNLYCCGLVSADGHQWTDSALATDYVEREGSCDWPRSYPDDGADALALSPAGCIWDDALAHGKTVRDYGEFTQTYKAWRDPARHDPLDFRATYQDFVKGSNAVLYVCSPTVATLRPWVATNTVGWDLDTPDIFRAAQFIKDLRQFEQTGNLPDFLILWLPSDHTSGTRAGSPTPNAQVADNDLAMGQIVDAVSHSRFWRDTCIFAVEDDPQGGADHVSSYRTTAYVASAYTRRGVTVSTQYNQTSLLRTLELMLGLPPMNQMDATATPMFDCFTNQPDFAAFDAVSNNVPLDEMNPAPGKIADAQLRHDARVSARLPLAKPDQCPEDVLNRILWRATMGTQPYPEWAVNARDDD